jgi:hypothetical protein
MVPDPAQSCLGLDYFCFEGDELWSASDEELLALATRELAETGLAGEEDVKDGCVVRQREAYPVYDDAYKDNVTAVRAELAERFPTLHLVGRTGMHKYNNHDHAMMTAMLTVKIIIAGESLYDVWNVNEDAEYHEAGVRARSRACAPCHSGSRRTQRLPRPGRRYRRSVEHTSRASQTNWGLTNSAPRPIACAVSPRPGASRRGVPRSRRRTSARRGPDRSSCHRRMRPKACGRCSPGARYCP